MVEHTSCIMNQHNAIWLYLSWLVCSLLVKKHKFKKECHPLTEMGIAPLASKILCPTKLTAFSKQT